MKKFLLSVTALSALVAGPAMAADLPVRYSPPPAMAPVVVSYYSWTGCYVGGQRRRHVGQQGLDRPHPGDPSSSGSRSAAIMRTAGSAVCRPGATIRSAAGCSASRATTTGPTPVGSQRHLASYPAWRHHSSKRQVACVRHRPRRLCLGSLPRLREGRRRLGAGQLHHHWRLPASRSRRPPARPAAAGRSASVVNTPSPTTCPASSSTTSTAFGTQHR